MDWSSRVPHKSAVVLLPVQDCLQPLSMQALPAQPESLCIVEMGGVEKQDELGEKGTMGFLYLNIGLQVPDVLGPPQMLWRRPLHRCDL